MSEEISVVIEICMYNTPWSSTVASNKYLHSYPDTIENHLLEQ